MRVLALAMLLAVLTGAALLPASAQSQQSKAFGLGAPATLEELPTGPFRSALEGLPAPARGRALGILRRFEFHMQDLPHLRVDRQGGVFFEDPGPEGGEVEEGAGEPGLEELGFSEVFTLHSRPGASRTVYLDMDGHIVTGTAWNNSADPLYMRPYDTDGNDAVFTQSELNAIAETWKRIAEDFAPYDIDVTTEEPPSFGPNVGHILVTFKADQFGNLIYNCSCGGVAYVGVWGESYYTYYQPALVFIDGVGGGPHNISEAASHELGHNLSLSHDATSTVGYYAGHGSGYVDWAPIMGVGYNGQVTQWSKGEYLDANNQQDDLAIIAGHLSYRPDDHEDVNFAQASPLTVTGNTNVVATNPVSDPDNLDQSNKGVIEDRSDVDLFYVDVSAGTIDLTVTPAWVDVFYSQSRRGMNLDVRATLYDQFGTQLAQSNPLSDTYAQITAGVGAGRYYLAIEGVGVGNPLTDGYSDYASIGRYFINGTVPASVVATEPPWAPDDLFATPDGDANIVLSWTDPASTPESDEDGYRVFRQRDGGAYVQIASLPRGSQGYADNNLGSGSYSYYVEVYNAVGADTSNTTAPLVISVPSVVHATGESTLEGAIQSGSYLDTTTDAGGEVLIEQHQGGRPQNRVSKLEHSWSITGVAPAAVVRLHVDAEAPVNDEGDDFEFAYAINDGPFAVLSVLANGTGRQTLSALLPSGTAGAVTLRVRDTDRTAGFGDRDTVEVHLIEVTSSGDAGDLPPEVTITAPADGITADQGEAIPFSGTAVDAEDGDLAASLNWNSSLDGGLGIGANLSIDNLSVGTHTITASVTDSASNPGSDSISVTVNPTVPGNTPPTVSITAPDSGATFTQGSGGFAGTADDAEDGSLSASLVWGSDVDGPFGAGATASAAGLSLGQHTITASVTDSGGLEGQHSIVVTIVPAGGISVDAVTPNTLALGTTVTVTVSGSGFLAGAALTMENGDGPAPSVTNVTYVDAATITADIEAKNGGPPRPRPWDVHVVNPDGSSALLVDGLTVNP